MLRYHAGDSAGITDSGHLDLEDFEAAGIRVAERGFRARDLIFAPGDPDGQLYFLLEGTVRLYKIYGEHKEATVALLMDRGVFGELGLDEGSRQRCFAEAVTETRVALVRKRVLVEAIKGDPTLATRLLFSFSDRLRQSAEAIESLLSREVSARLARLLLNLGERFGEPSGSGTVLKLRLTHQDLANMIVSTREAVSKVMSEFQRLGLIEVRNRRIC
ncbi:MAG TPA: Crp/Fnr family transcriptional regulator, partial [Rubrobacter sp.]|nr:Crp/Fnr family transcriptional regulator [Rubrobacter sp.]